MEADAILEQLRADIADDIALAEADLEEARQEVDAARSDEAASLVTRAALGEAIERLAPGQAADRLRARQREEIRRIDGRMAVARGRLAAARRHVDALQVELADVERALSPPVVEEAPIEEFA